MYRAALSAVLAAASLASASAPISVQTTDEEAIKATVRAETAAFYARDGDAWQRPWTHDEKATRTIVMNDHFSFDVGWDNIAPPVLKQIKEELEPGVKVTDGNFLIHAAADMAWVQYDQTVTLESPAPGFTVHTKESRLLVKRDGGWKLLSLIAIQSDMFSGTPEATEAIFNGTGYRFLKAGKVKEAIAVFKLNVELYPQSWNVYDSLGEAYAVAGEKALAIENYEKSLQLNPKSEGGKAALAKLRQK